MFFKLSKSVILTKNKKEKLIVVCNLQAKHKLCRILACSRRVWKPTKTTHYFPHQQQAYVPVRVTFNLALSELQELIDKPEIPSGIPVERWWRNEDAGRQQHTILFRVGIPLALIRSLMAEACHCFQVKLTYLTGLMSGSASDARAGQKHQFLAKG